ncbi:Sodium/hydrogen exchanger family-domain-containing protein [Linnemannia elongata]|nr:Sodium/hydrogen exchanger family-domain-containing protein [Linnemannia elongata]
MPSPIVFDTAPEHVAYALLGCFIIFFGLVSLFVKEKLFISEAFVSTAFGIIIGPYAIGIFDPMSWSKFDTVTQEFTRIVIAVQVMAAGVSLPRSYMVKEKRSLFMMIVPLMILMWLTSALLIWGMIPNLDFVESMVLAACVTPTDPVLSNSVVKGRFAEKHVPPRIRYLLSAESGINDGMGLPFLFLGLYLMRERTIGTAVAKWFYMIWAYQIVLSIVLGGLIGAAARKAVKGAKNRNLIDKESFLVFSIALALAVAGCVSILASDDLLACFIAGNVFAWDDWFSNEIAEAHIQETIDMLLNLACFVYIGASIPFANFHDMALELSVWRLIVLAILILMLRRLPFVMALKRFIPALASYREAAFAGWFGPIGVGAVFFSKVTASMTNPSNLGDNPHNIERLLRVRSVVYPVVMFLVLSSVLIHGVTVPLLHLQYNGSSVGGLMEGDAEQRTIGYDNQRSIGYDNQRSINQRSLLGYNGFGLAGPDLSRTSTNNTRTLDDVVQEMREAAKGKGVRSPNVAALSMGGSTPVLESSGVHPLTMVSSNESPYPEIQIDDRSSSTNSSRGAGQHQQEFDIGAPNDEAQIFQSLKESHPASQGLHIQRQQNDVRSASGSGSSDDSARTISASPLDPPPLLSHQQQILHGSDTEPITAEYLYDDPRHQYPQQQQYHTSPHSHNDRNSNEYREVEREEDNGVIRIVTHEAGKPDQVQIQLDQRHEAHPHQVDQQILQQQQLQQLHQQQQQQRQPSVHSYDGVGPMDVGSVSIPLAPQPYQPQQAQQQQPPPSSSRSQQHGFHIDIDSLSP